MMKRARRRPTGQSSSYTPIAALLIVGLAAAAGIVGLFVLLGGGNSAPNRQLLEPTAEDHVLGEPTAPVIIVEYADFQCPVCGRFARTTGKQIIETYVKTGQVRFVLRNFPFLGDESLWAAEAAECAAEQGAFWEYHDKLFAEQRGENMGAFSKPNLKRFAQELGLDSGSFDACLDSDKYEGKIQLQKAKASETLGVHSTPTLYVGDKMMSGLQSFAAYTAAIERAMDEAR